MHLGKIRKVLSKSRGIVLAAYLLFVIFPHFTVVAHSHSGGNLAHTHSYLSVQNENLKRQALVALGTAGGGLNLPATTEPNEEIIRLIPVERETHGLQPLSLWHTHFQEDPNLLAIGVSIAFILALAALQKSPAFHSSFFPVLPQLSPSARGPPAFLFLR